MIKVLKPAALLTMIYHQQKETHFWMHTRHQISSSYPMPKSKTSPRS